MLDIIKEILLAETQVQMVVGVDISTNHDTPEATLPQVTMYQDSFDTLASNDRESDVQYYQHKVFAMASGGGEADLLGKRVRAALQGISGTYTDDNGTTFDLLTVSVNDYDMRHDFPGGAYAIEMDVAVTIILSAVTDTDDGSGSGASANTFGIEFTGAFAGGTGIVGANTDAVQIPANTYTHLQFDNSIQATTDAPYWSDPAPISGAHVGTGLFGGAYLPDDMSDVFLHEYTWPDGGVGALSFNGIEVGGLVRVRVDFLVSTQVSNTTIEPALDWNTRDSSNNTTFQFYLTGTPVFFGTGTPGQETLVRAELSGYIASNEDANAIVRPVLKSNNSISVKPLSILAIIQK